MFKESSAKYYQGNKERPQKKAHERYQSLSKEEKENKRQYRCERYKNLPEDKSKCCLSIEKKLQNDKKRLTIISVGYSIKHVKNKNFFAWKIVFPAIIKNYFSLEFFSFFFFLISVRILF